MNYKFIDNYPRETKIASYYFLLNNFQLTATYPLERYKTAVQLDLITPQHVILKSFLTGNYSRFYTGFPSSLMQQNVKLFHWTFCMTIVPNWIDQYQFHVAVSTFLKGFVASSIDTTITIPFENIKIQQMDKNPPASAATTANAIYRNYGFRGFFVGSNISIAKALPSWSYLFLGYHLTKDKREQNNILSNLFWAAKVSFPLAAITTPPDVIKSQIIAHRVPANCSILASTKHIVRNHGVSSLMRGFIPRFFSKTLLTTSSYLMMDRAEGLSEGPSVKNSR